MPKTKTEVIVWNCDGCGAKVTEGLVLRGGVWLPALSEDKTAKLGCGPNALSSGAPGNLSETAWCRRCFEKRMGWEPTVTERVVYEERPSRGGPTGPMPPPEFPRFVRFTRALARR